MHIYIADRRWKYRTFSGAFGALDGKVVMEIAQIIIIAGEPWPSDDTILSIVTYMDTTVNGAIAAF